MEEKSIRKAQNEGPLIWMVIIGLCASPLLIPLAIGFIAVIFGLMLALLMLIVAICWVYLYSRCRIVCDHFGDWCFGTICD